MSAQPDTQLILAEALTSWCSDRLSPGFQLELPLITDTVPAGLTSILCAVDIAGQHLSQTLEPAVSLEAVIRWNGDDGFGRAVQGSQTALVTLAYYYNGPVNLGDSGRRYLICG